ncbi:MAG: phosphate/phosphite/phosphonate ABC transporter substrate-binding protein [Chloroflexota bacterium]
MLVSLLLAACTSPTPEPTPIPTIESSNIDSESMPVDAVRVAVLAIRSATAANQQYDPILDYLSEEIGRPFVMVPIGQEDQFTVVEQGEVDFTFNNPLAATQIRRLYDTEFLATLSRNNTGPEFSALIVVNAASDITTIEDLKDKKGTCVAFETAAAGCIFQIFHLLQQGIDPFADFASFVETPSQDNIILGVLNGTFDVGFVRTGQLEKMLAEGRFLSMDELRIIDQADDSFYFPHTTRLYPEWPMAALAETDPDLAVAVKEALLALPEGHPSLENANATGFVPAVDYGPLDELIETLELRSWDAK